MIKRISIIPCLSALPVSSSRLASPYKGALNLVKRIFNGPVSFHLLFQFISLSPLPSHLCSLALSFSGLRTSAHIHFLDTHLHFPWSALCSDRAFPPPLTLLHINGPSQGHLVEFDGQFSHSILNSIEMSTQSVVPHFQKYFHL